MAARAAAPAGSSGAIGRRRPVRRRVVLAHRRAPAPMLPGCDPGDADRPVSGDAAQPCRTALRSGRRRAGARERAAGRPRRACGPRWRPPVRGRADHHEHRRRPGGPHRGRDGDARRPGARRDRAPRRFRWAGTRPARRSGHPVGREEAVLDPGRGDVPVRSPPGRPSRRRRMLHRPPEEAPPRRQQASMASPGAPRAARLGRGGRRGRRGGRRAERGDRRTRAGRVAARTVTTKRARVRIDWPGSRRPGPWKRRPRHSSPGEPLRAKQAGPHPSSARAAGAGHAAPGPSSLTGAGARRRPRGSRRWTA